MGDVCYRPGEIDKDVAVEVVGASVHRYVGLVLEL